MALVKTGGAKSTSSWTRREERALRHELPNNIEKPVIDYENLRRLCEIEGLQGRKNDETTSDAHSTFMSSYKSVFVQPQPKKGFPVHSLQRSAAKASTTSIHSKTPGGKTMTEARQVPKKVYPADTLTHDIRNYLPLLHKNRQSTKHGVVHREQLKTIRKLLKKLPFKRTAAENDQLFNILKTIPEIVSQVAPEVLKELCVVATMDDWKEQGLTLFGNSGWHLILRGSVKPQMLPYHRATGEQVDFPRMTPEPREDLQALGPGECFGTLEKVEGREHNTKILTVMTVEQNCEFLKISCKNFARVIEKMKERDQTEKVNLLQSCQTFSSWSRQPLMSVADLIEWTTFPANTVLVSEGYKAPFIGFIKSGECHVLRHVEVKHTLPNGNLEQRTKQVVMGKLGVSDSFGEVSVVTGDAITCSIITATSVELGSIDPDRVEELDDVTRQLLLQSSEPTYGTLTQDDIHEEYVQQELKREWNEFKHNVVIDIINTRGIKPGYGKWTK